MERALYVALGLIVGVVVVLGLFVWQLDDEPSLDAPTTNFPSVNHDPDVVAPFTAAWERWRTATFVVEGTWTRTVDNVDEPFGGSLYTAQDPPRRLVTRLGSTVEQIDDQLATCDSSSDDVIAPPCVPGSGVSYDERVRMEMDLVREYVSGDARFYDLAREESGCFRLEQVVPRLAAPWGRWAEFCFDEESGALRRATVRRQTATDLEVIVSIRTDVTDADFAPS